MLQALLAEAGRQGAEQAEAYMEEMLLYRVRLFNGQIESAQSLISKGVGLRVIAAARQGYAYQTPPRPDAGPDLAARALAAARTCDPDPGHGVAACSAPAAWPSERLPDIDLAGRLELARRAEAAALKADPAIVGTEDVECLDYELTVQLLNSNGVQRCCRLARRLLHVTAVASDKAELQSGIGFGYGLSGDPAAAAERVGLQAAQRALARRGARVLPTTAAPVVFDPLVGAGLMRALSFSFSADALLRGRSRLADRLEGQVAAPLVHITDDGRRPDAPAARPFDGEGNHTGSTTLVRAGRAETLLQSGYSARRQGADPTGNAWRQNFRHLPVCEATNFFMEPGNTPPAAILCAVQDGLYVQEVQGLHTTNRISGDFSLGVAGYWLRDGELAVPVRGMGLAGNLFTLLEQVDAVGSDLTFVPGNRPNRSAFGAPTFRVAELVISGK